MIDFNQFVGIPWKCGKSERDGADCFGILCLVYDAMFDIQLNHFDPSEINSNQLTTEKIEKVISTTRKWRRVLVPRAGDAVVMIDRSTNRPDHVGVFVGNGKVLHSLTRKNGSSSIHDFKFLKRIFKRLEFYQYVS